VARRRGHLAPVPTRDAEPVVPVMLMVGDTAYQLTGIQAAIAVLAARHREVCNQAIPFYAVRFEVTPAGVELRDDRHHAMLRTERG
jgi:hypothetical protein